MAVSAWPDFLSFFSRSFLRRAALISHQFGKITGCWRACFWVACPSAVSYQIVHSKLHHSSSALPSNLWHWKCISKGAYSAPTRRVICTEGTVLITPAAQAATAPTALAAFAFAFSFSRRESKIVLISVWLNFMNSMFLIVRSFASLHCNDSVEWTGRECQLRIYFFVTRFLFCFFCFFVEFHLRNQANWEQMQWNLKASDGQMG